MHFPVGRSVIASLAAKAAVCQLLGHSESRQACVVSTYIKGGAGVSGGPSFVAVMQPADLRHGHD